MDQQEEDIQDSTGINSDGEIERLRAENEELLNNWKRAAADLENFKKRKEQEGAELLVLAKEAAVFKLLPSLQSLEQVLSYAPEDDRYRDWLKGLKATIQQLEKAMEELGVKKIPTVGQPFDHSIHEAVGEAAGKAGEILEEVQPGFTLNDRVIVPAKVVVGSDK
ncbi:MAG: nucleotide exchange factor GrpE [Candidatus Saccharibacteria bacterium]